MSPVKFFQITEDDLQMLEKVLPEILDRMYGSLDARMQVKFRNVQKILSNVRWNYGPPTQVISA